MTSHKFVGDSNFRDVFTAHREALAVESGVTIEFEQATSVASIKTLLDGPDFSHHLVFIGSPTNEIALKSKNNTKSREGIIESVVSDLFKCVNEHATNHPTANYIICQPFLRQDPPWLEGKLEFYKNYIKACHCKSPSNVHVGSDVNVGTEDLKPDRIHLNKEGLEKLRTCFATDILIAKDLGSEDHFLDVDEDMEEAPLSHMLRSSKKTPLSKKRSIEENSEDEGRLTRKKKAKEDKLDAVLAQLSSMNQKVQDLHDDRTSNKLRFDRIDDRMRETTLVQEDLKEQIEAIKQSDNSFCATIKEDLDAVENSNLRDTVILKKVATDKTIPTDRKELSSLILEIGKEILKEVMGSDTGMKFIAPLYFRNDKCTPKGG